MTLLPELIAAYRFARRPKYRKALERRGLVFGGDYLWGVAHVAVDALFYEPDPEGTPALIVGAFELGALIDLVAVSSVFGLRTRRGDADLLGHDALETACLFEKPLDLYADAWSWLRHDCRGATIVNWRAAPGLLRGVPRIRCETAQLAERVDQAFARPIPCPPLLVFSPKQALKET
jgi:hypothetical protein